MLTSVLLTKIFESGSRKKSYKNLLTMFYQIMDIPVKIIDKHGELIYEFEWKSEIEFPCHILHKNPRIAEKCRNDYQFACLEALRWGDSYISHCQAGFYMIGVPILMNEEFVAGFIAGPFLMRHPNDQFIISLVNNNKFSTEQEKSIRLTIQNIPVVTEKRVKLAAELLYAIADFFSVPDLGLLNARRQLYREQAQVAEEIQRYKRDMQPTEHHLLPLLNPQKEKELITKVRVGDKIGAKAILNELLGQVMLHHPIDIDVLKVYVLELSAILTRAVVEQGANSENILGLRYQFLTELSDISTHEALCFWVVKVMESICDNIYQTRNNQHFHILEQACNYIKEHYQEKLTLSILAKHCHISPFYLCHLFKEDLHTTFGEYLAGTRVEAAKTLLRETDLPLSQIALEVGYPDQSYFTKVFKKIEKITPKTFRKLKYVVE